MMNTFSCSTYWKIIDISLSNSDAKDINVYCTYILLSSGSRSAMLRYNRHYQFLVVIVT